MLIGVPKEIKVREYRVGLVPHAVRELVVHGHEVLVERGSGLGIGATDAEYAAAGAELVASAAEVFARAGLVVKVKEPLASECAQLRRDQLLFTYLHLAADAELTERLLASGATCIAYETVTGAHGGLPLLAPMSAIAGRLAVQAGVHYLEKTYGGRGILPGGIPGVPPAQVAVLGGGVVGSHAVDVALGMGARVCVLDRDIAVLERLAERFGHRLDTQLSTRESVAQACLASDLVVCAVLVPGAAAPRLITREIIAAMQPGSVIVDVAIDQGGGCETSRPTTHDDPVYSVDEVIHYCVANMPGSVPRTSAYALNNATLPYVIALANKGLQALQDDPHLRRGLNVHHGRVTNRAVAEALGYAYTEPEAALLD